MEIKVLIKINLTPIVELESQFWWWPDAVAAASAFIIGFYIISYLETDLRGQIELKTQENAAITSQVNALEPEMKKFKNLEGDIAKLRVKLDALSKITSSKESRYKTVIVMEHIQNLKPEGLWFKEVNIKDEPKGEVVIEGYAFDNALVAEFMTSLKSTYLMQWESKDLRSHIVNETSLKTSPAIFDDLKDVYFFKINFAYEVREKEMVAGRTPEDLGIAPLDLKKPSSQNEIEGKVKK